MSKKLRLPKPRPKDREVATLPTPRTKEKTVTRMSSTPLENLLAERFDVSDSKAWATACKDVAKVLRCEGRKKIRDAIFSDFENARDDGAGNLQSCMKLVAELYLVDLMREKDVHTILRTLLKEVHSPSTRDLQAADVILTIVEHKLSEKYRNQYRNRLQSAMVHVEQSAALQPPSEFVTQSREYVSLNQEFAQKLRERLRQAGEPFEFVKVKSKGQESIQSLRQATEKQVNLKAHSNGRPKGKRGKVFEMDKILRLEIFTAFSDGDENEWTSAQSTFDFKIVKPQTASQYTIHWLAWKQCSETKDCGVEENFLKPDAVTNVSVDYIVKMLTQVYVTGFPNGDGKITKHGQRCNMRRSHLDTHCEACRTGAFVGNEKY